MLRFIDGFDYYNTSQITRKWTNNNGLTISSGTGRSNGSLRYTGGINASGSNNYCSITIDSQSTWIIGFAFKINASPSGRCCIMQLLDGGTTQIELRLKTDNTLEVTRNGTNLGTTSYALSTGIWYYIEIKVVIHDSTGSVTLKVNNDSKLSLSNVDTKNTSNATANQVLLGMQSNPNNDVTGTSFTIDYDDLYICDSSGSANNDFLGDVKVATLFPNANGNNSALSGSDGNSVNNYQLVDDNPSNDDSDYVESSNIGDKDTYGFENLSPTPASVKAVQINMIAKKTDVGTRTVCPVIRISGTDYDKTSVNLTDSYANQREVVETDPSTSAAWTGSAVDNAEFGMKIVA